ncbi:hypothetical protein EG68_02943 [Paragonimus skrjabini miyazakii]|uniref:Uncharacterized protein n=1 Tax=Paragonimus skrjabini miyazakii TaxID=59628 RepID=A0A8S9Z403_9TREM|nr:hypothetical protein EG68_02943 [Paragonimus skrjabini miyazakii]
MIRFYCLLELSKSSLNRRLFRLTAEQDDPAAFSDIVTDELFIAASVDRGTTVVDAPGNVYCCSPSTSGGQPVDQIAGTMPGLRAGYFSGDKFTGSISDDVLATYMRCNMSLTDLGRWLRMLNFYFPYLPIDPRTTLRIPRSNELRCIGGGEYVYLGLTASLPRVCCPARALPHTVHIQIYVDEMAIFRDTLRQCWPIQGRVISPWLAEAFVVGIFHGDSKLTSVAECLEDLIAELDVLLRNGLRIPGGDVVMYVTLQATICDSLSRAYIEQIKGHAGRHGYDKCVSQGVRAGRPDLPSA